MLKRITRTLLVRVACVERPGANLSQQDHPSRVGRPPGSASDTTARIIAEKMQGAMGQPVIGREQARRGRPHRRPPMSPRPSPTGISS